MYDSTDTPWVAQTLFHYRPVKQGKVSSNSSIHKTTKFGDSICLVCVSTFKCLFNRAQPARALTDTGCGYHLGALNFISDYSSSFSSSIIPFPLIAPLGLQLCQYLHHLAKPHRTSVDKRALSRVDSHPLDFYHLPIQLTIAYYRCLSVIGVNKVV
jgi:hypothetical protein